MKKQLEKFKGSKVELRLPDKTVKGLLCKALATAVRPYEWYLIGGGAESRFVESEVNYILTSIYKHPVIVLKDIQKIPSMKTWKKLDKPL